MEELFHKIIADPRYVEGVTYGKPRRGHQEGTVSNHIMELEKNLHKMESILTEEEYWKLSILIHVHDTFKKWATSDSPIDHFNSHASLAAKFLSEFTDDKDLIAMVQWHDENFALWKKFKKTGAIDNHRFVQRVLNIVDIELFLLFTIIDGYTESKMELAVQSEQPEKLRWFTDLVNSWRRPTPRVYQALELFGL